MFYFPVHLMTIFVNCSHLPTSLQKGKKRKKKELIKSALIQPFQFQQQINM